MSRGYIEGDGDCENPACYLAHTWVERAIAGKRGQGLLRDIADALDSMPEKRLVPHSFGCDSGVCTLGALGSVRGLDMSELEYVAKRISRDFDDEAREAVGELNDAAAATFGVARSLVADIMWRNDAEGPVSETPEHRWARMRSWVDSQIQEGT